MDSLVGFLQSPRWTHPLNNFVDEKCVGKVFLNNGTLSPRGVSFGLVFDPGEENKFSYTDIHKQYSNLVRPSAIVCCASYSLCVCTLRWSRCWSNSWMTLECPPSNSYRRGKNARGAAALIRSLFPLSFPPLLPPILKIALSLSSSRFNTFRYSSIPFHAPLSSPLSLPHLPTLSTPIIASLSSPPHPSLIHRALHNR